MELRAIGGLFYRLPNKFRKTVLGLLEEYKAVLPYREALKEKVMDFQGYSDEEKQAICVAIDHVNSIEILRDYQAIAIERLERVPVPYEHDKEIGIDVMDWLVTIGDPGSHNANFKIIDSETYEYLAYIPGALGGDNNEEKGTEENTVLCSCFMVYYDADVDDYL